MKRESASEVTEGNILVVEDHPINQKLMTRLLEIHGFRVVIADNGRQALELFARELFDLVLMDMQMPDMDGLEATRRIREQEEGTGRRIPIIALTANAFPGDRERCLDAGMDGYLSKPVRSDDLLALLRHYLRSSTV